MSTHTPHTISMVVVFLFILGIIAIRSIAGVKQKRAALEIVRHAIDRAQPLEPAAIEALLRGGPPDPRVVLFGGIMCASTGVGVGFIAIQPAAVLIAAGIGLIVSSLFLARKQSRVGTGT